MKDSEIKFNDLQHIISIDPTHRPLNIYDLMHKYGYKHFVKCKEDFFNISQGGIKEKESGAVAKEQPNKDFRYYYIFDKNNNLCCFNTEEGIKDIGYFNEEERQEDLTEPIYTTSAPNLIDLTFYEYGSKENESLLDFVKRIIYRKIESYTYYLTECENKNKKECKPYLTAFQTELNKCNEETINIFIFAFGTFAFTNAIFFETYDNNFKFIDYLNNLIKIYTTYEAHYKEKYKESLFKQKLLLALLNGNITDNNLLKQNTANILLNADVKTLTTEDLYKRYKIESDINGIKEERASIRKEEAISILEEYKKGKHKDLELIFNNIFDNYANLDNLTPTTTGDNFISANNIMTNIKQMLCISRKAISEKDIDLYKNIDNLSQEERKALNKRIRNVKKEKIEHIISYLDIKKEYAIKTDTLKQIKAKIKEAQEKGEITDFIAPLEEEQARLKTELEEINNNLRNYSENIIPYDSNYYYNDSPNLPTYINEKEGGKIEISNKDNSIKILKDQKTAVMENELTSLINMYILMKISKNKKNPIYFSNSEIYKIMHDQKLMYAEEDKATKKEKQNAKDLFYLHCTLLNGYDLQYTELKLNQRRTSKSGIGTYIYQVNRDYNGIELYFNNYLLEEVVKKVSGFISINEKALNYSPNTTNLLFTHATLEHMHTRGTINGYELDIYTSALGYTKNNKETLNIIDNANSEGAIDYEINGSKVKITDHTESYEHTLARARAKNQKKKKKK